MGLAIISRFIFYCELLLLFMPGYLVKLDHGSTEYSGRQYKVLNDKFRLFNSKHNYAIFWRYFYRQIRNEDRNADFFIFIATGIICAIYRVNIAQLFFIFSRKNHFRARGRKYVHYYECFCQQMVRRQRTFTGFSNYSGKCEFWDRFHGVDPAPFI